MGRGISQEPAHDRDVHAVPRSRAGAWTSPRPLSNAGRRRPPALRRSRTPMKAGPMQRHATAAIIARAGSILSPQTVVAQAYGTAIEGREGVANMTGVFTV